MPVALELLEQFCGVDQSSIRSKGAFFNGILSRNRSRSKFPLAALPAHQPFAPGGDSVQSRLQALQDAGRVKEGAIDERCLQALHSMPQHEALAALDMFGVKDLTSARNMSALLMSCVKAVQLQRPGSGPPHHHHAYNPGPAYGAPPHHGGEPRGPAPPPAPPPKGVTGLTRTLGQASRPCHALQHACMCADSQGCLRESRQPAAMGISRCRRRPTPLHPVMRVPALQAATRPPARRTRMAAMTQLRRTARQLCRLVLRPLTLTQSLACPHPNPTPRGRPLLLAGPPSSLPTHMPLRARTGTPTPESPAPPACPHTPACPPHPATARPASRKPRPPSCPRHPCRRPMARPRSLEPTGPLPDPMGRLLDPTGPRLQLRPRAARTATAQPRHTAARQRATARLQLRRWVPLGRPSVWCAHSPATALARSACKATS